jgi:hypothetical protein
VGESGQDVDGTEGAGGTGAGRDETGEFDEARAADTAIETGAFGFAEGGFAGVMAVGDPGAVIGGEENEGMIGDLGGIQGIEDFADGPIEFHHDVAVEAGAGFILEPVTAEERHVRHRVREIEEEGLILVAVDEIDGAFREPGGEEGLVVGVTRSMVTFAIDPVLEGELAPVFRVFGMELPHVIGVHDAAGFSEAARRRAGFRLVADVPFAEDSGGIALGLEYFAERGEVGFQAAGVWGMGAEDAGAAGVTAGEEGGARSGADGLGDVEIVETRAFVGEALECWVWGRWVGRRAGNRPSRRRRGR